MIGLQYADAQESRFQPAKRSNTGFAVLQGGRFPISHESCFQTVKRSYMGSVVLRGGQFADSQEWHLRPRNV